VSTFKEYLEQVQERELFRIRNWKKESLSGLADFIYTKFKNLGITNSLNNEMINATHNKSYWRNNQEFIDDLIDDEVDLRITDQNGDLVFYEHI